MTAPSSLNSSSYPDPAGLTTMVGQDLGAADTKAKAELVIRKAVQQLGGEKYLQIKTHVGRGKFSVLRDGGVVSCQTFVDIIAFPDRERTEFKGGGTRTIQVNTGSTGWIYDDELETFRQQTEVQVENFKRGMRTSLDNILRGYWRGLADLSYVGRRSATLGKRNDVIKLTYKDGFSVEFGFADDGLPQKALSKRKGGDGEDIKEEDRYAQFGESRWITGEAARAEVQQLRAAHDAVLIRAGTARADDPELLARTTPPALRQPVRVVLDTEFSIVPRGRLFATLDCATILVIGAGDGDAARRRALEDAGARTEGVARSPVGIDAEAALAVMLEHGIKRVLCEGGGQLAASLIAAEAVDRLEWFRAPMVLGADGRPSVAGLTLSSLASAPRFRRVALRELGPDIWESYERVS